MSFASKVLYTGDGVTTDFTVPFPYMSQSHVSVYVNEILQLTSMNYNWSGTSTISFVYAPGIDDAIEIKRWTSPTATLVDFVDGSTLRADDLDTAYLHNYYLSQEYADSFNELINEVLIQIASGTGILETETDAIIAALVNEMLNDANAANLQARITDIDANAEAIIELGTGLQAQINTLAQGVAAAVWIQDEAPVPGVGGVPNPIPEGSRWYDSDDNNHPYIYQSSAWVSIEDPRIGVAAAQIDFLNVQTANTNAALVDEMFVRAQETESLSQRFQLLGATSADAQAFILDLDTAKVSETESLSNRFSQITADWTAGDASTLSGANGYTDGEIVTVNASITSEATARADADSALASTIALLGAENGTQTAFILNEDTVKIDSDAGDTIAERFTALTTADSDNAASIASEQTARINGDTSLASDITTLTATVNGNTASINTNASAIATAEGDITTLEAKYGVSLNVNGYITGFVQNNDGTTGSFVILADKFAVVDPSGDPGEPEYIPFLISGGKVRFNTNVEIDGDLMISGTINGSALINGTIGSTQIGANAITTTQLNANAVTAAKISANAVTADKINVTNLAAVNADLGDITAGTITMDTSGYIRGGATSFTAGTGFWMGYDGSSPAGYKFRIGNTTDNFMQWDGDTLQVIGDILVGEYSASNNTILSASTERTATNTSYFRKKTFTVDRAGTVRVEFEMKRNTSQGQSNGWTPTSVRIYKNSTIMHTDSSSTTSYVTQNYDVAVEAGDKIHLDLRGGTWWNSGDLALEPATGYIRNAAIQADVALTTGGSVDLN